MKGNNCEIEFKGNKFQFEEYFEKYNHLKIESRAGSFTINLCQPLVQCNSVNIFFTTLLCFMINICINLYFRNDFEIL